MTLLTKKAWKDLLNLGEDTSNQDEVEARKDAVKPVKI